MFRHIVSEKVFTAGACEYGRPGCCFFSSNNSGGKSFAKYIADKMFFGGIYKNSNGHLPQIEGRIWYETDLNYKGGKRNKQRVLWSNDGLIFVTYDHYLTFNEIV